MNRLEYIELLRDYVSQAFSLVETEDIIRDYEEFFAEGLANGKSEAEVIAGLGSPKTIVQQLVAELEPTKKQTKANDFWHQFKIQARQLQKKLTQKMQPKAQKKMSLTTRVLRLFARFLAFGAAVIAFVSICFVGINMIWTGVGAVLLTIVGTYFTGASMSLGLVFISSALICASLFLIGLVVIRVLGSYVIVYSKRLKTWWDYHVNQVPGGVTHE